MSCLIRFLVRFLIRSLMRYLGTKTQVLSHNFFSFVNGKSLVNIFMRIIPTPQKIILWNMQHLSLMLLLLATTKTHRDVILQSLETVLFNLK